MYSVYHHIVSDDMNIGFTKMGDKQPKICLADNTATGQNHDCSEWRCHVARAEIASYQTNCEAEWPSDTTVRSVDLQKVIMLLQIPGVKSIPFTKRIIAFHHTFTSVGQKKNKPKNIAVVWNEGLAGHSAPEITLSFHVAIATEQSTSNFIFWADNCMAQNKNWILFSCLIVLVNSSETNVHDVTIKYYEPGHTFVSAYSVYARVDQEMQKAPGGNIYDFQDFVEIIKQ